VIWKLFAEHAADGGVVDDLLVGHIAGYLPAADLAHLATLFDQHHRHAFVEVLARVFSMFSPARASSLMFTAGLPATGRWWRW